MIRKLLLAICCLISLAGCGDRGVPTGAVAGKVTFQGTPLPEGSVLFVPTGAGYVAQATIGPDGTYSVKTKDGGLPLGEYGVAVVPTTIVTPDGPGGPGGESLKQVDNIPVKYRAVATSGLKVMVTPEAQTFDISMVE